MRNILSPPEKFVGDCVDKNLGDYNDPKKNKATKYNWFTRYTYVIFGSTSFFCREFLRIFSRQKLGVPIFFRWVRVWNILCTVCTLWVIFFLVRDIFLVRKICETSYDEKISWSPKISQEMKALKYNGFLSLQEISALPFQWVRVLIILFRWQSRPPYFIPRGGYFVTVKEIKKISLSKNLRYGIQ